MTHREIALKLAKQACFEGEGPSLDWSKAARPIEAALDSAKRAGKIEALEWVLDGNTDWLTELDRLRSEQAKEEQ